MFSSNLSMYFIAFVGVIFLLLVLNLSRPGNLFLKRKRRHSHPPLTIAFIPFSHQNNAKDMLISTTIALDDDDDEDLIKCDSSADFSDTHSIELRLDDDHDN